MSHNSYVRPLGVWNANQVVSHNEFAALDRGQFVSINGDDGGTWAPTSPIGIFGAGISMRLVSVSTVTTGAELTFSSGATLELQTDSIASISSVTSFETGSFTGIRDGGYFRFYAGSIIDMEEGAQANFYGLLGVGPTGNFACQGGAVFTGSVTQFTGAAAVFTAVAQFASTSTAIFQGNENHVGSANFSGALSIAGDTSLTGKVTASGAGRVVKRIASIPTTGANSSAYGPFNYDRVIVQALTADVTFTINDAGAVDGDEIFFTTRSAGHYLSINDPSAGLIASLKNTSGQRVDATFYRLGGEWHMLSGALLP